MCTDIFSGSLLKIPAQAKSSLRLVMSFNTMSVSNLSPGSTMRPPMAEQHALASARVLRLFSPLSHVKNTRPDLVVEIWGGIGSHPEFEVALITLLPDPDVVTVVGPIAIEEPFPGSIPVTGPYFISSHVN